MTAPQPSFAYYDDTRYSTQPAAYPNVYGPRSSTSGPGHQSDVRKLPPLSTTPTPGRDDRWASYPAPAFNTSPNNPIRSPTASYPPSYTTAYPPSNAYGYHVDDPRGVSALSPQLMANDPRAASPYGRRGPSHISPPTPPPVSPIGSDEPAMKKKRKRADAAQLRVLNETYARTAFPSTEERLALAKALDMSPRSVQIW
jgi:homeobox protein YOX1/YHP1